VAKPIYMKYKFLFILLITVSGIHTYAQDYSAYQKQVFIKGKDTLPYRILLPKHFSPLLKYPLIVFLHGSGERGSDNESQLSHGADLFLRDSIREKYPAIIVFPQCPASGFWSNVNIVTDSITHKWSFTFPEDGNPTVAMGILIKLFNKLEDDFRLDKKRIYIGGLSMGGMGTFELVRRKPKMFAAAFPICGGANPATAAKLIRPHWWIFHGEKDDVVNPQLSKDMAAAIKNEGGNVTLTLYPDANHNSWDSAFAEKDLLQWLFSNHK
jgi:predicted peptidase